VLFKAQEIKIIPYYKGKIKRKKLNKTASKWSCSNYCKTIFS